jgi:DNA-binding LytR/AlgR family response regulator
MFTPLVTDLAGLRCVVTDDDSLSRQALEAHIAHTPSLSLVASLADGTALLEFLQHQPPVDILFLDIQMPLLSGLEVLRMLPKPPAVVFITSRPDFAVEAFELRAVDYLVKPIAYPRFFQAVNRVHEWRAGRTPAPVPVSVPAQRSDRAEDAVFIKTGGRLVRLLLSDILYVEAVGQYAVVVTIQNQYSTSQLLRELEKQLPSQHFTRVHRSYLVNQHKIESVEDATIRLEGGRTVPIGRTYLSNFLASLTG